MDLTKQEKEVIVSILKKQLELVEQNEGLPEDYVAWEAAEIKYSEFLENLIKKLS